jgi:hypothetical protein
MFHLHCFTNYSFIPSPSLLGCSDPRASTLRQRCQVWSLLGCSYPRAGHLDERLGEQGEGERLGWASGDQAAAGRGSEQQRQAGSGWAAAGQLGRGGWANRARASDWAGRAATRQRLGEAASNNGRQGAAGRVGRLGCCLLGVFPVAAGTRPGLQPRQPRSQICHCLCLENRFVVSPLYMSLLAWRGRVGRKENRCIGGSPFPVHRFNAARLWLIGCQLGLKRRLDEQRRSQICIAIYWHKYIVRTMYHRTSTRYCSESVRVRVQLPCMAHPPARAIRYGVSSISFHTRALDWSLEPPGPAGSPSAFGRPVRATSIMMATLHYTIHQ